MFESIERALEDIRQGKMVIVVDDEDRENEGDVLMAAEKVTPEAVNFMASHARGLICAPITASRAKELELPPMVADNTDNMETAFTVSVDFVKTGTGISAPERALTIRSLIDPETEPRQLRRPGHIFPLVAREGGVLRRAGHTEAAVDLSRLAGLYPAGVICEIMKDDGTMARMPDLVEYASKFDLSLITIEDLIRYRRKQERLVERVADTVLSTEHGEFRLLAYRDSITGETHVALVKGDVTRHEAPLVRVHSQCLTGDVFGSRRCDCGAQLDRALDQIHRDGAGVLLYMRQEGRGIGLENKLKAYALQDEGMDTVQANEALGFEADPRDYGIGAQILRDLGIENLRLLTNNPRKMAGLRGYGLNVTERVPIEVDCVLENRRYLEAKRTKLGHMILGREAEDESI